MVHTIAIKKLQRLRDAGIQIGSCRPSGYPETTLRSSDLVAIMQQAETDDALIDDALIDDALIDDALIMDQAETDDDSKLSPPS